MKAWALIAAGAALAGCFEKPPFRGDDDGDCPAGDEVSVHDDGGRPVVCGPGYSMSFSAGGFGFPDSFTAGGVELLGHGDTCDDEDGMGLAFYPAGVLDGRDPGGAQVVGGRRVEVELEAPFLIKVGIDWQASFGCSFAPAGRTIYTFFRGGRIARHDVITDDSTATVASCATACEDARTALWTFTGFTTLRATTGQSVTHVAPPRDDDHGPGVEFQQHELCVTAPEYTLGLHWSEYTTRRVRVPAPGQLAFVQELLGTEETTVPAAYDGSLHDAIVVARPDEDCAAVEARTAWYYDGNPQLVIDGDPYGAARDGIYGGEYDQGTPGRELDDDEAVLGRHDTDLPGGLVAWFRFQAVHDTFEVTKTGGDTSGTWYEVYRVPHTTGALFWFRDPIRTGETITIRPAT